MSKLKSRKVQASKIREFTPDKRTIPVSRLKFLSVGDYFTDSGISYRITHVSSSPLLSTWKAVSETGVPITAVAYHNETQALVSIQF